MFSDLRRYTELRSEMLYTMISPEEAAEAGVASAKHAAGAKDEEMPEGFMACPRIWKEDRNKACPYQYNHAIY